MDGRTTNSAVSDHVVWAWETQSVWSQAADKLKASLFRARHASLVLSILAAAFSALAQQVEKHCGTSPFVTVGILSVMSALSMALVTVLQTATRRVRVESWSRARSVSEALKAEVFKFLAGVAPYRDGDPDAQFKRNVDEILADADDIGDVTVGLALHHRPLPAVNSVDSYAVHRVQQQIDAFYRPKSALMKRRAGQYRFVESALAVIAAVLSAGAALKMPGLAAWIGVVTTIVAATTAHAAVQRYDALAVEYARTYRQLERLLRERGGSSGQAAQTDADADDQFVAAAEEILSVQNQAWMARNLSTSDRSGGKP